MLPTLEGLSCSRVTAALMATRALASGAQHVIGGDRAQRFGIQAAQGLMPEKAGADSKPDGQAGANFPRHGPQTILSPET